jgi:hypothetical protein
MSDGTDYDRQSNTYDMTNDELTLKLGQLLMSHMSAKCSFDPFTYTFIDHGVDSMGTEYGKTTVVEIGGEYD